MSTSLSLTWSEPNGGHLLLVAEEPVAIGGPRLADHPRDPAGEPQANRPVASRMPPSVKPSIA